MICQWQSVLQVLPPWMRQDVDKLGCENLQELRLRLGAYPELCMGDTSKYLSKTVSQEDLRYTVNAASRYSPWACACAARGYLTISGGHRMGLCGDMVVKQGSTNGVRWLSSLCIRISRDFPGISRRIENRGSILIAGAPGSGKTTLLRDLIRTRSDLGRGSICVVDERCEIFPVSQDGFGYPVGKHTDVLSGCSKGEGLDIAVRCMSPKTVAVDEITAEADCKALHHAALCGVELIATVHAGNREELYSRPVYKPLIESGLFQTLVLLRPNKSYTMERMTNGI